MSKSFVSPSDALNNLKGERILVKLKWGLSIRGYLVSCDKFMNLQLQSAEEIFEGKTPELLGEVLIRCNNVLYIDTVKEGEGQ